MDNVSDRELLRLAAKAAGIKTHVHEQTNSLWIEGPRVWNPLADDGDALRLAVKLGLFMHCELDMGRTQAGLGPLPGLKSVSHGNDLYAATRRAIVRAAAEIGRAME